MLMHGADAVFECLRRGTSADQFAAYARPNRLCAGGGAVKKGSPLICIGKGPER